VEGALLVFWNGFLPEWPWGLPLTAPPSPPPLGVPPPGLLVIPDSTFTRPFSLRYWIDSSTVRSSCSLSLRISRCLIVSWPLLASFSRIAASLTAGSWTKRHLPFFPQLPPVE